MAKRSSISRTWFIGIGIDTYENYTTLSNPRRDVSAVEKLLVRRFGVTDVIVVPKNKTKKKDIIQLLSIAADKCEENDDVIIYYAGHGTPGKRGKGFWLPSDASEEDETSWIPNSLILDKLDDFKAKHLLLLCDSCFSGTLIQNGLYRGVMTHSNRVYYKMRSRWIVCSSTDKQVVEDGLSGQHSPFAKSILDILGNPMLSEIRVRQLVEDMQNMISQMHRQTIMAGPMIRIGDEGGNYVFRTSGQEEQIWEEANRRQDFNHYLVPFPRGHYAELANSLLNHSGFSESLPVLKNNIQSVSSSENDFEIVKINVGGQYFYFSESNLEWSDLILKNDVPASIGNLGAIKSRYKKNEIINIEVSFALQYAGYKTVDGTTVNTKTVDAFWTSTSIDKDTAYALVFNRVMGKAYFHQIHKKTKLKGIFIDNNQKK